MDKANFSISGRILSGLLLAGLSQLSYASDPIAGSPVEEIYIGRFVRESRTFLDVPSDFCDKAKTGFAKVAMEDRYTLRSTATRGSDGRMVDADVQTVGGMRACFGVANEPDVTTFYAEGTLGDIAYVGRGECRFAKRNYPVSGITSLRCFLELSGLPKGYVGGHVTTNSLNSLAGGLRSDPPGYTQSAIATFRFWKQQ